MATLYDLDNLDKDNQDLRAELRALHAELAAARQDAERLAEALRKQSMMGCFCLPEDYSDIVEKFGAEKVEHSEYCKSGNAALTAHDTLVWRIK